MSITLAVSKMLTPPLVEAFTKAVPLYIGSGRVVPL